MLIALAFTEKNWMQLPVRKWSKRKKERKNRTSAVTTECLPLHNTVASSLVSCNSRGWLAWLNIPQRVSYKLRMLTHRCLREKAPGYLLEYRVPVAHVATRQHLRSAARHQLTVPRHRLSTYGRRAFAIAGPWPSTLCLIICVIHQSTLQRLRDH